MSPRRRTMLIGGATALLLFAVMALVVNSTRPWEVTPASVQNEALEVAHDFEALYAAENGATGSIDQARETAADGHALAEVFRQNGNASVAAAIDAAADRLKSDADAADDEFENLTHLRDVGASARALAGVVGPLQADWDERSAFANDLTNVTDSLFGPNVIAFEVLGILLTAAMIGALVIARPLDAPTDESRYSHPTDAQKEQADAVSDPAKANMGVQK